jgi:hypothetical protein
MSIALLPPFDIDVFSPESLGDDLLHWWSGRFPDLITTAGGSVSSLVDVKASAELTQGTSGARPANSGTLLNFDGFDDRLSAESTFSLVTGNMAAGMEIWARVRQDALPADTEAKRIFAYGGNGTGDSVHLFRSVVSGANRASGFVCSSAGVSITEATVDFSGTHTLRIRAEQTRGLLEIDGVSTGFQNYAGAVTVGTTRTRLGAYTANTALRFWKGGIKDVVCTALLDDETAAKMRVYLAT